jgi:hypothetical protein
MAGVRIAVKATKEATYGTFNGSATSADKATFLLPKDNPFMGEMAPEIWKLMSAGYDGRQVRQGTSRWNTKVTVNTHLFPAQAELVMNLALGIGLSGNCRTFPSATIDVRYILEDSGCTLGVERYFGCQVETANFNANNQGDGCMVTADLNFVAQKRTTILGSDFAEPAGSDYPATDPFLFQDTAGTLNISGAITEYSSLNLTVSNKIVRRFYEARYPTKGQWRSREVGLAVGMLYKSNTLRDARENQTAMDIEWNYINALGDNLKIDLGAVNYIDPHARTFPLQGDFEQSVTIRNCLDTSTGNDIVYTYTPHV